MLVHPFLQSGWRQIKGALIVLLFAAMVWALLMLYGGIPPVAALVDSILYTAVLSVASFMCWNIIGFMKMLQSYVFIILSVQIISLGATFMLLSIFKLEDTDEFVYTIPLRVVPGILSLIILMQWYIKIREIDERQEETAGEEAKEVVVTEKVQEIHEEISDTLDRISVKDNSRIHIIKVEELVYVQAYGDYVMLFTHEGKYIKELTMKYLEANLPSTFIRVHRSHIVNTDFITRVELFGKETYQVRLKDGTQLRVSNSGYKLLKDRLLL